jgi:hypothetical protein
VLLGLCVVSDTSRESDEWDSRFEGKNVVAKLECFSNVHSVSGVRNLTAMLEVNAKVGASRLGSLFRHVWCHRVSDHFDLIFELTLLMED